MSSTYRWVGWCGGPHDFSFSPIPLGTNLGLELDWTLLGLGLGGFGVWLDKNLLSLTLVDATLVSPWNRHLADLVMSTKNVHFVHSSQSYDMRVAHKSLVTAQRPNSPFLFFDLLIWDLGLGLNWDLASGLSIIFNHHHIFIIHRFLSPYVPSIGIDWLSHF